MTLDEWKDVIVDVATAKHMQVGLPPTQEQIGRFCDLVRLYWTKELADRFAANDTWFRHRLMERIWGNKSTKVRDMAAISAMIDEIGRKDEEWALSQRGKELLDMMVAELETIYPVQLSF